MSWHQVVRKMSGGPRAIGPSTMSGVGARRFAEGDGVLQMLRWLHRTPESFVPGFEVEGMALPEVGANGVLRFDTRAIYEAVDAKRIERGISWTQIAREIGGVAPSNLTYLAKGKRTGFPHVMRICRWLGRPAASFARIVGR